MEAPEEQSEIAAIEALIASIKAKLEELEEYLKLFKEQSEPSDHDQE